MMRSAFALAAAASLLCAAAQSPAQWAAQRERMVATLSSLAATAGARGHERIRPSVLEVMRRVPRHLLVPEGVRGQAYGQSPLPIGYEATISAPYIVALMTDLLGARPGEKVLEVGTGSGYQAAVLSQLTGHVYSIEIVEPLARRAAADLARLGYRNVTVRAGDGYAGWPEQAPFDRIIVTAAAPRIPSALVAQLKRGGRMVIPVGRGDDHQLTVVDKDAQGRVRSRMVLPVRFVPMVRGQRPGAG